MIRRAQLILFVSDQAAARAFWSRALDLSPTLDVPGMTEFTIGPATVLGLMPAHDIGSLLGLETPAGGQPRAEVYLLVDDPETCHRRALAAGARLVSPLGDRPWGHEAAYSMDPDGHLVVFARIVDRTSSANPLRGDGVPT